MRETLFAIGICTAVAFSFSVGSQARADDSARAPTTGSTKPHNGGGPAEEKSLPSSAPRATTTQTTGATDQNKTVKAMNNSEQTKANIEGK